MPGIDLLEGVALGLRTAKLIGKIAKFKSKRSEGGRRLTRAERAELKGLVTELAECAARDFLD